MKGIKFIILLPILLIGLSGCISSKRNLELESSIDQSQKESAKASLGNPASKNCQDQGGQLQIKQDPQGGQYGVCLFDGNKQCEEWAMFRGECPVGGVLVGNYETEAQIYCAIKGFKVLLEENMCQFKNQGTCDLTAFYEGSCLPAEAGFDNLLKISEPTANQAVSSPLAVKGEARGTWFFEGSFPVKLLDSNGQELFSGQAQAQGDWMTENFVPFVVTVEFPKNLSGDGKLILKKDNPSGLPANEAQVELPVKFK